MISQELWFKDADAAATKHPEQYKWFLDRARKLGYMGALDGIIGEDAGICHIWALKVHRDHPEIPKIQKY